MWTSSTNFDFDAPNWFIIFLVFRKSCTKMGNINIYQDNILYSNFCCIISCIRWIKFNYVLHKLLGSGVYYYQSRILGGVPAWASLKAQISIILCSFGKFWRKIGPPIGGRPLLREILDPPLTLKRLEKSWIHLIRQNIIQNRKTWVF